MKKQFIFMLCAALMATLAGGSLFAQDNDPVKPLPLVTVTSTHTKVPEKVWQNFQVYFAAAENPAWYELNKKYLVKFTCEDKRNYALFTKKGNLVYNISYWLE